MRLIDHVEQLQPSSIAAIDERRLNSGYIEAGGPGSGRHKIEGYLKEQGFSKSIVRGTVDGNDHAGRSHWAKTIKTNKQSLNNHGMNTVTHSVAVEPDGSWSHSVTGIHGGDDLDHLKNISLHANKGNSLKQLKALLAGGVGSGRHKQMADALKSKKMWRMAKSPKADQYTNSEGDFVYISKTSEQWKHSNRDRGTVARGDTLDNMKQHIKTIPDGPDNFKQLHSMAAGGPGSGRKPDFGTTSKRGKAVLDNMHKDLQKQGYRYKNSSTSDSGNTVHNYESAPGKKQGGGQAHIIQKKLGDNHSGAYDSAFTNFPVKLTPRL